MTGITTDLYKTGTALAIAFLATLAGLAGHLFFSGVALAHGPPKTMEVSKKPLTEPDKKRCSLFTMSSTGTIIDSRTGLEWLPGPDTDTNWDAAKRWVGNLPVDGVRWRLPTPDELESLYVEGAGTRNMVPLFLTTGWWIWSGEMKSGDRCWYYDFHKGRKDWSRTRYGYGRRAFAVRKKP